MDFPYGKAPLAILIVAVISSLGMLLKVGTPADKPGVTDVRPDIVFATFTKEHAAIYRPELPAFEQKYNCKTVSINPSP